tara:strand:+ start:2895 stop:3947 length:1053 start_codon:yes stop_codon:yes gene_type:complete
MKQLLTILCIFGVLTTHAQEQQKQETKEERQQRYIEEVNPFRELGYKPKISTLSKGKYREAFPDSIVQIGNFTYNIIEKRISGVTLFEEVGISEATAKPEIVSRWMSPDPLSDEFPSWSPYNFTYNNPILNIDPDGRAAYPIITITKQKTGQTAEQRVLGYTNVATTEVDLYKVVVTDTEDSNFRMEFSITRDAWTVEQGNSTASNVAFEPKDGNVNHFTGKVMDGGYPKGNGTEALKLTQKGSEVVHAESNQTSVNMGYRTKADVASGVMIHVGGNYDKNGSNRVAASEGCFGVCNDNNSSTNQSNSYSNNILKTIQNQADKSVTNPGHIRVVIEKREGNEYPKTKKIN